MFRKKFIIKCLMLLGGLYAVGLALWRLGGTAMFVHEAILAPGVVVDVRERPFEDYLEMFAHGNFPWEGSVAHQPHVRYEYAGLSRVDSTLPDLDNQDYDRGQSVEIILHPEQPHLRHLNKFKFVWGRHLLLLGGGLFLLLLWRVSTRLRRRSSQPRRRRAAAQPVVVAPVVLPAQGGAVSQAVTELVEEIAAPAPKKRRRASKPKDPNAPAKPRARKSSKSPAAENDPTAAPKKRRRRTKDSTRA